MEKEIQFGADRVFIQVGTADDVASLNSSDTYAITDLDDDWLDWGRKQDKQHVVKVRIEYHERTSNSARRALSDLITCSVSQSVPCISMSYPLENSDLVQDIVYMNSTGLLDAPEAQLLANHAAKGLISARAKWYADKTIDNYHTDEHVLVAKVLARFAPNLTPLQILDAEDIIVEHLGSAQSHVRRISARQRQIEGLAFYLGGDPHSAHSVVTRLGAIGINTELTSELCHRIGEEIYLHY